MESGLVGVVPGFRWARGCMGSRLRLGLGFTLGLGLQVGTQLGLKFSLELGLGKDWGPSDSGGSAWGEVSAGI